MKPLLKPVCWDSRGVASGYKLPVMEFLNSVQFGARHRKGDQQMSRETALSVAVETSKTQQTSRPLRDKMPASVRVLYP